MSSITTLVTAKIITCAATWPDGSMNCGRRATKNRSAFGFAAWTTKPFTNVARAATAAGGAAARVVEHRTSIRTPSQIR